jgi:hypothetical protein
MAQAHSFVLLGNAGVLLTGGAGEFLGTDRAPLFPWVGVGEGVEVERLNALVEFALAEILASGVVDLEPAGREGIGEDLEGLTVGSSRTAPSMV